MPRCFVCGRENASFRFPRDPTKCRVWTSALKVSTSKPPKSSDRLCDQHFDESCVKVTKGGYMRLAPWAVPKAVQDSESEPLEVLEQEPKQPSCHRLSVIRSVAQINEENDKNHTEEVNYEVPSESNNLESFNASTIQALGNLCIAFLPFLLYWISVKGDLAPGRSENPAESSPQVPVSDVVEMTSNQPNSGVEKNSDDIDNKNKNNKKTSAEDVADQSTERDVENFLKRKGLNPSFISEVMEMEDKKKRRYTQKQICTALVIHSICPRVYDILRNNHLTHHDLPHRTTLAKRIKHFQCQPGIQTDFFKFVKMKLSAADFFEKQSVIMFDEMDLLEKFEYCDRLKMLFKRPKKVQLVLLRYLHILF